MAKYIIELSDEPVDGLYRHPIMKTCVFDEEGIKKLKPYNEDEDLILYRKKREYQLGCMNSHLKRALQDISFIKDEFDDYRMEKVEPLFDDEEVKMVKKLIDFYITTTTFYYPDNFVDSSIHGSSKEIINSIKNKLGIV